MSWPILSWMHLIPLCTFTDTDFEEHCSQDRFLWDTTNHPTPPTHGALDPNPMAVIIQTVPYPLNSLPLRSICLQLTDKDIMWGHVKGLAQVHVDGITYFSFAQWCCHFPIEVHQMGHKQYALGEAMMAVSDHLLFKQCVLIWLPGESVPWYPPTKTWGSWVCSFPSLPSRQHPHPSFSA